MDAALEKTLKRLEGDDSPITGARFAQLYREAKNEPKGYDPGFPREFWRVTEHVRSMQERMSGAAESKEMVPVMVNSRKDAERFVDEGGIDPTGEIRKKSA